MAAGASQKNRHGGIYAALQASGEVGDVHAKHADELSVIAMSERSSAAARVARGIRAVPH